MRFARLLTVSLACGVAAVGVAACGGSSSSNDANTVIRETFSGSKKITSGNLSLAVDFAPTSGSSAPLSVKLGGPFASQGSGQLPNFDLSLGVNAQGQSFQAGAASTGTAGFLKFQGQSYSIPPDIFAQFKQGFAQAQNQQKSAKRQSLSSFGVNPQTWITNARLVGDADVAGTATQHVTASINVPRFLADINRLLSRAGQLGVNSARVPTSITPQQAQQIQSSVKTAAIDVYSGKGDHILRRLSAKLDIQPPSGKSARIGFDLVIAELNAQQTIHAPANPRPLSDLTQQFKGLGGLGGLLGGQGASKPSAPGAAATPGSSPSVAKLNRYSQCLTAAAGDAAKAQQCAALLR